MYIHTYTWTHTHSISNSNELRRFLEIEEIVGCFFFVVFWGGGGNDGLETLLLIDSCIISYVKWQWVPDSLKQNYKHADPLLKATALVRPYCEHLYSYSITFWGGFSITHSSMVVCKSLGDTGRETSWESRIIAKDLSEKQTETTQHHQQKTIPVLVHLI